MYFVGKMAFLIWCMAPVELNGSDIIYKIAILPFFIHHKDKIDKLNENITEMANEANKMTKEASFAKAQRGMFDSFKSK